MELSPLQVPMSSISRCPLAVVGQDSSSSEWKWGPPKDPFLQFSEVL